MNFTVMKTLKNDGSPGVLADQIISLSNQKYPETMWLVTFSDGNFTYRFLTNIFNLDASAIADLYQQRWAVELFFKWIKQHLKIEKFIGSSKQIFLSGFLSSMFSIQNLIRPIFAKILTNHHYSIFVPDSSELYS